MAFKESLKKSSEKEKEAEQIRQVFSKLLQQKQLNEKSKSIHSGRAGTTKTTGMNRLLPTKVSWRDRYLEIIKEDENSDSDEELQKAIKLSMKEALMRK